ncbi:hypothetical protein EIP86_004534 [Pleurotus ostreatoroseus]|nr:hypothetical protein EIP86_004534 [Pleurotus ostreatoroseus]
MTFQFSIDALSTGEILSRYYATNEPSKPTVTEIPKPRLDYRSLAENVIFKSHNAFNRKASLPPGTIQIIAKLYEERKATSGDLDYKRHMRSVASDKVKSSGKDLEARKTAIEEAKLLKETIVALEVKLAELDDQLHSLALAVPNDTHPDTPIGPEAAAKILSEHGPPPRAALPILDHVAIGRELKLLDLEAGSSTTGSSWYYLMNEGALLEMALVNYAMSIAIKHGFTPVTTPDVVRADIAYRCGFQPRDRETIAQMYHVTNSMTPDDGSSPPLVLAGTAEIPLAGMFVNKIHEKSELPVKLVGLGKAFRAEAGARGTDTRGLYRVHQFTKLELFVVCEGEQSEAIMEDVKRLQIEIFEGLGLTFRVLDMPTEELGASAYRKYDIEAWMPGRDGWGEISSTSNCTDYQARRLHIRYRHEPAGVQKDTPSGPLPFAHTLNGTAAAVPRLIVALIENGARFDEKGKAVGLNLPKALKPFWVDSGRDIVRWV